MRKDDMNIKTKDIASKSGVSIATVSRYLNKSGYVKQKQGN
ncbi:bacterial regulatory s, lacI family protein [[Clostridium] sordellii ATCC 9714]|nr:bacterial regulatory s, lacI family protein [[Clostridium] sordellii ATCC 9714] [Paeniclostridium sordellii ATCC 9714]